MREFFRSRKGCYLIAVLAVALAARAVYYFHFGVRLSYDYVPESHQLADPELLRSSLLETCLYLRDQPPLFNLFLGVVLKAFPGHAAEALQVSFLACGLVLV